MATAGSAAGSAPRSLTGFVGTRARKHRWRSAAGQAVRPRGRRKLHHSIEDLQADLDDWMRHYNTERTHQGRWCYGKTPMQTFVDMLPVAKEKLLQAA